MTAAKKNIAIIRILLIAAILIAPEMGSLWIMAGIIDFLRVRRFRRPLFCILTAGSSFPDGGSGTYVGFLYSFEIEGSFLPGSPRAGVTAYTAKILNTPVMTARRPMEKICPPV